MGLIRPNFKRGDVIEYKASKRGYHYGFDNGQKFIVIGLNKPISRGEWGGWLVRIKTTNSSFPANWFKRLQG